MLAGMTGWLAVLASGASGTSQVRAAGSALPGLDGSLTLGAAILRRSAASECVAGNGTPRSRHAAASLWGSFARMGAMCSWIVLVRCCRGRACSGTATNNEMATRGQL